jgi:hypothetical protein
MKRVKHALPVKGRQLDVLLMMGFFLCGVITRVPFTSRILYHWDSVNFALALEHFDVRIHQPQPPGYVLYVLLGRALNLLFHDPNISLVWISILFSGLAVAAIFWLGRAMFGQQVGLVSAGLALTSPLFWFHGEVALSYITEGFFVTAIAFCCYKQLTGDERYVLPASLMLGIAGGFRQNTLILLLPLWLFPLFRLGWRKRIAAVVTLVSVVGIWLAIMFYLSGGFTDYWQAFNSQSQGNLAMSAAGPGLTLAINVLRLTTYGFYALTAGLPLLSVGFAWALRHWRELIRAPEWQVILVWLLPSLVFYTFFVQQAGYTFTFSPAVLLTLGFIVIEVIPRATARWKHSKQWGGALLVLIALSNIAFFLIAPPFLFGQKRQLFNTPSWSSIRTRNIIVSEKLGFIRDNFSPENTAILANQFDFRLPDYYLRDYRSPSLSHQKTGDSKEITLGDGVWVLVLFNEEIDIIDESREALREEFLTCGESLRWLERSESQEFILSTSGVGIKNKEANKLP